MCPACFATAAWIAGGTAAGGGVAWIAGWRVVRVMGLGGKLSANTRGRAGK